MLARSVPQDHCLLPDCASLCCPVAPHRLDRQAAKSPARRTARPLVAQRAERAVLAHRAIGAMASKGVDTVFASGFAYLFGEAHATASGLLLLY